MKSVALALCSLMLALVVVAPLNAADKAKKKEAKQAKHDPVSQIMAKLEGVELTADQQTKLKELTTALAPKLKDAQQKAHLTKEQAATRKELVAKNKADGLKGKQAKQALDAALKLTKEQQEGAAELHKLRQELNNGVFALLTEEQRTKSGITEMTGKGKQKAKKKDNA